MFRAEHLLVTMNRLAARKPEAMRHLEDFLAQDLPTLAPLAIDVAIEQGDPLGRALANVLTTAPDPGLAVQLHDRIPGRTTALREAAVIICGQIAIAAEAIPGIPAASIASTRISLAYRLSEAGQDARAASELQQAVQIL